MFVNRERELATLEQCYASDQAELFVLYGRRRVGKTELLRAFCQDKRHLFYVADLGTEATALAELTRQVSRLFFESADALSPFTSWDTVFEFLATQAARERLVVVLDEFTYLIDANAAIPSILQRLWDARLQHTRLMLVLCGSYVGLMEQHVLAYRAPLYGRRTGQWQLRPLSFWDIPAFLPGWTPADLVRAYAVLGGVPAYLQQFDPRHSLVENIGQAILSQGRFLYDEPRFLLLQELRDPHRYFAVLEAVAGGRTRLNEIAQAAGIAASSLSFYLNTLQEMGLVERVVPATETQPHKSKQGIYRLLDHFFRFWFRFVYPNRSLLERGETGQVLARVGVELDQYTGPAFEAICREYVWQLHRPGALDFTPQIVGNWWDRREEIDVAAIGKEGALFGECKWAGRPVGVNLLEELRRKTLPLVQRGGWRQVRYALFARSGFTPQLQARAAEENVLLVDLNSLAAGES